MQLSDRLETILDMAGRGETVADIGTDHGYVPIELVSRGRYQRALAMDVRKGPLERAGEHIRQAGLSDRITTRLSDGLEKLAPGEAETIIIAGMGGPLMQRLIDSHKNTADHASGLILSPQSEVGEFHRYILSHGYKVEEERYVEDDNKIYVVMRCVPGTEEMWDEIELLYGRQPLREREPILKKKLEKELRTNRSVAEGLQNNPGDAAARRREELNLVIKQAGEALARMEEAQC